MSSPHLRIRSAAPLRALFAAAVFFACGLSLAQTINDVPMAVKNNVAPNFMFMIDNSGSMSNIVQTSPYNAVTDYTPSGCVSSNVLAAGTAVDIRVVSTAPFMRISGINYRHWTLAASGSDLRCFNRTAIYAARLLGDVAGSPSAYLSAVYNGNYLNWYFGNADGHPVTGWSDRKRVSSGSVQTRLEIAKASATSVLGTLPTSTGQAVVRAGLSTYNGGDGGALRVGMGDLTPTLQSTLQTSVSGLTASSPTPMAETLADIGRYMATGYSGNITAGTVSGVSINSFLQQDGRQSCLAGANCLTTTTDAAPAQPSVGTLRASG